MWHWDRGLFLTRAGVALDVPRRQKCGFMSHAHADHIARHELGICTPDTARLVFHRLGQRQVLELPYRKTVEFGPLKLTTFPAGHCLGSAMLLAEDGEQRLLYTGDYKLGTSVTCEAAELPQADVLVMESTFGQPRYRLPPRDEVVAELIDLVRAILDSGKTPVIHAYALGKSQEVSRLLTRSGIAVQQHPQVFAVSEVYGECGVEMGDIKRYERKSLPRHAVVTLPKGMKTHRLAGIRQPVSITVTGWAMDTSTKYRHGVDHALPLSDHADFDELVETVERVGAREVICTHGPKEFVGHLRALGVNARPATGSYQLRMF